MDTINLILEYINTPDNVYKDYLHRKIEQNTEAIKMLEGQESALKIVAPLKPEVMLQTCVNNIKPNLEKYQTINKTVNILASTILATSLVIGSIFMYNTFFKKSDIPVNIGDEKETLIVETIPPKTERTKTYNNLFNVKSNTNLLTFAKTLSNKINKQKLAGYSGDITQYKEATVNSSLSDIFLEQAAREVASGALDIEQVDSYLQRAIIDQHDVEVIEDIQILAGREEQ